VHTFETVIRLQHTDAAGVIFYARLFDLAHLAFEDLLDGLGHPLPQDLPNATLILPIVRAQADYRGALRLGDALRIDVDVAEVRSRSFSLAYRFTKADGSTAATCATVHAAVDRASGTSAQLPEDLATALRDV